MPSIEHAMQIAPSGFIEREMLALREAAGKIGWGELVSEEDAARRERIMAAQQALAWALDPTAYAPPSRSVTGVDANSLMLSPEGALPTWKPFEQPN